MSSGPPGTRREDEAGLVVMTGGARTYQKVVRSGARDQEGTLPPDRWAERDVAATLAPNDLGSDSRACELVLEARAFAEGTTGQAVSDVHPTLQATMPSESSSRQSLVVTHALTSEGADASEDGTGRGTPLVASETTVRRLSPLECERLQGFPDGWTAVDGQADSPRYRQMGNAVAVPVVEWILRRLVAVASEVAA